MYSVAKSIWSVIEKLIRCFFRLFHIQLTEQKMEGFLQFVKFGMVGLSSAVVNYAIYLATLFLLQSQGWLPQADYLISNAAGFLLSVLWSFYWNRKCVFHAEEGKVIPWPQALLKTYISYAFTGLFLNSILSVLWIEVAGFSKVVAPILNVIINVPINFLLNKLWAFRSK